MKKIKKLLLSTAMFGALCALGTGLTSKAEDASTEPAQPTLSENFSFVEEFDYGDGTIDAYGGSNNHNIYANNKQDLITTSLLTKDNLEVLNINILKNSSQSGKISFRDNASAPNLYNKEGGSMVLKFKFNIDHGREQHFGLYFHANDGVSTGAKTYELLRMRDEGTYYRLGNGTWVLITDTLTGRISKNEWHEATFILQDNGDLLEDGKSQDKIIAFLDGNFIYETNFADNDNFQGKLTEFFYNLPTSNTSVDINAYIDYIRIGDYNAPVASEPVVSDVKVNIPFDLTPTITGTDSAYLPSVTPNYSVDFSLNDVVLTSETASNGMLVFKSNDEEIIGYENGRYVGLKNVENLKATIHFDSDFIAPINVVFDIAENTEEIPVTDIATDKIVMNNTINLGINEEFNVSKLFRATPSTASNTILDYTISDDSVISLVDGVLKGVSAGTATLTVTAPGGTDVSKVITVNVCSGPFEALNYFTTEDSWTTPVTSKKVGEYRGYAYTNKDYSPITVVEDDLFGYVLKFEGKGAANSSASHLDLHVSSSDLTAYKDYKLTGWIKMDVTTGTTGRFDIKVFDYQRYVNPNTSKVSYYYASQNAPYYVMISKDLSILSDGWVYFETSTINFDPDAIEYAFNGLKIELGFYNSMQGVDGYIANLNLVEQDTVTTTGWDLIDNEWNFISGTEISAQTQGSYRIYATAIPSIGELNAVFASSDETIATVDQTGNVTFLNKAGSVEITVTNGDVTKKVTFNVSCPATSITVPEDKNTVEMSIGDIFTTVDVTITPADATSTYTATSADATICQVDFANGQIQIVPLKVGTTTITLVADDNADATVTITVVIKGYTVTYNANGHGEAPETLTDVTSLPVEFVDLTAEGFIFGGWFFDADCTQKAEAGTAIEADTTLYAKWTAEGQATYKVTYNVNGHGEAPAEVTDVTSLPTTLPTLTVEGWKFEGWFLDADCTQKAEAGAAIEADTILYAKWTEEVQTPTEPTDPVVPVEPEQPKSGPNVAAIVVPIVVVVVLAIAGVLVYFLVFKKKELKNKE
ncbi:MAG: InlB B-repeat-containing protein [Anaeroplasmataceae bacterium]|nr:InlB B-repeat-containing protein [Anaeroplasmataceae bacterium]